MYGTAGLFSRVKRKNTCTVLFMEICVQEDMELQVREEPVLVCAVERREVQGVQKGNRVVVLVYGIE